MPAKVTVTITGITRGTMQLVPYNPTEGLQHKRVGGVIGNQLVTYEVPIYEVRVEGAGAYTAMRFGLQNKGTIEPTRTCDVGISNAQMCTAEWVPTYRPHSFGGRMREGAWRLFPGRQFLIHEGPNSANQLGGSYGCVEILDGRWNDFLADIERLGGASAAEIGKKMALKVAIQYAAFPTASLAN